MQRKATDSSDIFNIQEILGSSEDMFSDLVPVRQFRWYMSGEVLSADNYSSKIDTIRNASENDTIEIYINSFGGDLFAALQICQAIRESHGTVIGVCDGQVASAATFIALACPHIIINRDVYWMSHTASWGLFGKSSDIFTQTDFERSYFSDLMQRHYGGFFTQKEIDQILKGGDFYFNCEQVLDRLNKRNVYNKRLQKQQDKVQSSSKQQPTIDLTGAIHG